jgi:integrase
MQLALWNDEPAPGETSGVYVRPPIPPTATGQPSSRAATHLSSSPRGKLAPLDPFEQLKARATNYLRDARADNTRRAYAHDWRAFEAWCAAHGVSALPASSEGLALYLTHLADLGRRPSTIRRARIAIGLEHALRGATRPDQHAGIRQLERGIGRTLGAREEGAPPLLAAELAQAVKALGHGPRDLRDRALLLVGFAGAFRRSELAGLNLADVRFTAQGLEVSVRRSKEDQLGHGATTTIPFGTVDATCPVRALRAWIGRVGRPAGPLFRVINGAVIEHQRISTRCVSRAVQRAVERAHLDGHYSAHSLRSGLATSAYVHGATEREIQLQGRWRDPRSVQRYVRLEHVPGRRSPVQGLL